MGPSLLQSCLESGHGPPRLVALHRWAPGAQGEGCCCRGAAPQAHSALGLCFKLPSSLRVCFIPTLNAVVRCVNSRI